MNRRIFMVLLAVGISVAALLADTIGISGARGFGWLEVILLLVALATLLLGVLPAGSVPRRLVVRVLLLGGSVYLSLLLGEIVMTLQTNAGRQPNLAAQSIQGIYRRADKVGFELTPGWQGTFDDGVRRSKIQINSMGARDDEPSSDRPTQDQKKILLIGDSFTFGYCLDQSETIDKQIEQRSGGKVDAYNLGVGGYGPGDTLERFRSASWWQGSEVFYFFFHNDLRKDNSEPGLHTAFDGYSVPTFKPNGQRYTDEEYRKRQQAAQQPNATKRQSRGLVSYTRGVIALKQIRQRVEVLLGADTGLIHGNPKDYSMRYVESAARYTGQMRDLAADRGLGFYVVIVPSKGEAKFQRYSSFTGAYVDMLRSANIQTIELIDRLSSDEYFVHDTHFNPSGAAVAAEGVLEVLGY